MEVKVIRTVSSSIPLLRVIRGVLLSCMDLRGVVNTLDRKGLVGTSTRLSHRPKVETAKN